MTWKRIIYGVHAVRRLRQRRITRRQVRQLLATGAWQRQGVNRWLVDGPLERWPARLVVRETADTISVITVMWLE